MSSQKLTESAALSTSVTRSSVRRSPRSQARRSYPYGGAVRRSRWICVPTRRARARPLRRRREQRHRQPGTSFCRPARRRSARTNTTSRLNNSPSEIDGAQRPADQGRERRDHQRSRRRLRARRPSAADEHRARQRPSFGADDDPEDRLGLDARHRQPHSRRSCRSSARFFRKAHRSRPPATSPCSSRPRYQGRRDREGIIAAALTALMILLFLGSWRSHADHHDLDSTVDPSARSPC